MADSFDSGGIYDLTTDTLPRTAEQLLYGLNYSENPLSFEIEIVMPDDKAIPPEQVMEVKNWLFGQDGWKKFRTIDDTQDYYLECLLIPEEDIVDVYGVRGFRCTLQNNSAFWYKDHEISTSSGNSDFTINVESDAVSSEKIFPIITYNYTSALISAPISIKNETTLSAFIGRVNFASEAGTDCTINCRWATVTSESDEVTFSYSIDDDYPYIFYLVSGENNVKISSSSSNKILFQYTTKHRIGAF